MKTNHFSSELHRAEFHREKLNTGHAFELALHTAKPVGSDQSSYEINIQGYSRVTVQRDKKSWKIDGIRVSNAVSVRFPKILSGNQTARFLTIGINGKIRRILPLDTPLTLAQNRWIEFAPGEIQIDDD